MFAITLQSIIRDTDKPSYPSRAYQSVMSESSTNWYTSEITRHSHYLDYQTRYSTTIRESDRILIDKVREIRGLADRDLRVLDVGCSTGNLLVHLKRLVPGLTLFGLDISRSAIDRCRGVPELTDVPFVVGSGLDLAGLFDDSFDIVIANAMVHHLNNAEFTQALQAFSDVLTPAGHHLNFDGFHPFEQDVALVESCPHGTREGIHIHYRSYTTTSRLLSRAGFASVDYREFTMPFDLERDPTDFSDLSSYTIRTAEDRRMCMRGVINQTWCHLHARKMAPA